MATTSGWFDPILAPLGLVDNDLATDAAEATSGSSVNVTPGIGVLLTIGIACIVATPRTVHPGVGALTVTSYAPTVSTPRNVKPGVGSLTLTGNKATVATLRTVKPSVGAAVFAGLAPLIATPRTVAPFTGLALFIGRAPTVTVAGATVVLPNAGVALFSGSAPTVQTPVTIRARTGAVVVAGYAPTVTGGGADRAICGGVGPTHDKIEYVGKRVRPRDYTKVDSPTPAERAALRASEPEVPQPAVRVSPRIAAAFGAQSKKEDALRMENQQIAAQLVAGLLAQLSEEYDTP